MDFRLPSLSIAVFFCFLLIGIQVPKSTASVTTQEFNPPYPKEILDLKEAIVKTLGFQANDFKIFGFDLRDARVGKSVAYEFDVEIDNKTMPLKLLEDASRWEYVDLPIFQTEQKNSALDAGKFDDQMPVLAPFQLAGPMELWIQDAKDMRISLPHDVDAGVLKKVVLADGAVVTVKGARSVSLRHPVELPLPLNRTNNGFASSLLTLAKHLQDTAISKDGHVLSLRIVGPTSIASTSPSSNGRLKLKRLAPGLVELSSASKKKAIVASPINLHGEATALLTPDQFSFSTLWPVVSINASNSNLLGFEALLSSVLGPKANEKGSFKLLKADVSAQTFLKMGFGLEKKLTEGDGVDSNNSSIPEWRTKPRSMRMHFEVMAKIEGNKVVPERVVEINPVKTGDSSAPNVLMGNITMSKMPIRRNPVNPFTL